jgi:hypothetical protein
MNNFFEKCMFFFYLSIDLLKNLYFTWTLTIKIFTWPRLNSVGFWEYSYKKLMLFCMDLIGWKNIHMWLQSNGLGSWKCFFDIENWKFLIDQGNVMPCITINIQLEHYVYVFFVYWKFWSSINMIRLCCIDYCINFKI